VVALLGAAMLASLYANPSIPAFVEGARNAPTPRTLPPERPLTHSPLPSPSAPGEPEAFLPRWVGWALTFLCLGLLLAIIVSLLWTLLRDRLAQHRTAGAVDRSQLPNFADTQRAVRAAVDVGLADLDDSDADPRRAVIACWVRLERAAAVAGTPREPGDTSTDLVARLLASHMVSGDVLAGLAAVYREARFATHTVDAAMRDQARSALRLLRDELMTDVRDGSP
jgi:hypothetical protein